jgi:hypothetical protein
MDRMVIIEALYNLLVGVPEAIGIDQDRSLDVPLAAQISRILLYSRLRNGRDIQRCSGGAKFLRQLEE